MIEIRPAHDFIAFDFINHSPLPMRKPGRFDFTVGIVVIFNDDKKNSILLEYDVMNRARISRENNFSVIDFNIFKLSNEWLIVGTLIEDLEGVDIIHTVVGRTKLRNRSLSMGKFWIDLMD